MYKKKSLKKVIRIFLLLSYTLYTINSQAKIQNKQYISLNKFLKNHPPVYSLFKPLELIIELRHETKKVRMQVDSSFYIDNGHQITTILPPLYQNEQIYLPKEIIRSLKKSLSLEHTVIEKLNVVTPIAGSKSPSNYQKKGDQNFHVKKNVNLKFIVIDPGHGGRDPGAQGYDKISEKEVTLLVGKRLAHFLQDKFPTTKIILTRKSDQFISLERRGEIANRYYSENNFGIFLSLHCNATFTPRSHGFEIYYLHRSPSNEEARLLMIRKSLPFVASKNIKKLTSYLIDSQIQKESKTLAMEIHRAFTSKLKGLVSSRGIRRADFSVMRSVSMPALLIEMGYITNMQEANMLRSNNFFKKMSEGIAIGIRSFLEKRPTI